MNPYILEAQNITKVFGSHTALDEISLNIPRNSIFGLLGPNGAGKTTLIRIINQITYPDKGQVLFDGSPLKPEHIARIGYLPEERGLYKSMKVGEQALYLAQLKGLSKQEAKKRLLEWFERLEIGNWWDKKIQELSKGMAQKIQFIVTVLHQPKLLIFDEPFSGFDPINANQIKDQILELRNQGASIIFSTHRMESVEELCEHIALIHKSKKILEGRLSEVKKKFKTNEYAVSLEPYENFNPTALRLAKGIEKLTMEKEVKEEVHMKLKLETHETAATLSILTQMGNVVSFQEIIPSANDIFIQSIKATGTWES